MVHHVRLLQCLHWKHVCWSHHSSKLSHKTAAAHYKHTQGPPPNDLEHFHSRECKSFLINIQQGISLPPWWFVLISVLWPMTSWLLKRVILLDKSENSELRTGKVLELGSKREETFWRIFVFYSHVSALKSKLNVHEGELNVIMHEPLWLKTTDSDRLSFQLCTH